MCFVKNGAEIKIVYKEHYFIAITKNKLRSSNAMFIATTS
jgi:hypothetical protein